MRSWTGTVNSLPIALARHEVFPIAFAQRCCGSNVPRPGQDGKVTALSIALARHDAPGPGPGRTVDVLPSTHAPRKRRRGNSSEPGLGLDGNGRGVAHRTRSTRSRNFSCMPGLDGKVNALPIRRWDAAPGRVGLIRRLVMSTSSCPTLTVAVSRF